MSCIRFGKHFNHSKPAGIRMPHSTLCAQLSPYSMERVLERFRRRLCTRLILARPKVVRSKILTMYQYNAEDLNDKMHICIQLASQKPSRVGVFVSMIGAYHQMNGQSSLGDFPDLETARNSARTSLRM